MLTSLCTVGDRSIVSNPGKLKSLITLAMPNPVLVVEVVSPGNENIPNYQRDYEEKPKEYAARGI